MFMYFPDNKLWSQATLHALNCGADINDVERACADLAGAGLDRLAWAAAWSRVGDELRALADADGAAGRRVSAANKYRRAAIQYLSAERLLEVEDAVKAPTYDAVRETMSAYVTRSDEGIDEVEVPYLDTSLPAFFVPALAPGPHPVAIVIDGFDVTRDVLLLRIGRQAALRGISLLVVDTPGVGEALRRRELPTRYDTEVPVGACIDYLEQRDDVDLDRIGLIGISLGGYYASRAAAFEGRLRACVVWGAFWTAARFTELYTKPLSDRPAPHNQLLWVTGQSTVESALRAVEQFELASVIDKITCHLLVLHGQDDHLVPIEDAERTAEGAVNAASVELRVYPSDGTGSQHCQVDGMPTALDDVFDWLNGRLVVTEPAHA